MTTSTVTKPCVSCKQEKSFSAFYTRSGVENPTEPGHYLSECIACMKARGRNQKHLDPFVPRAASEKLAMAYLWERGYPCFPGKVVQAADVDVVVFGHVWLEVKYARLKYHGNRYAYMFNATPKQQRRGFLAHVVLLMCEHPQTGVSYHLFDAKDPVFYIGDRVKAGVEFVPGKLEAVKHGANRVVMTQGMMDAARDRLHLIDQHLAAVRTAIPAWITDTQQQPEAA